MSYIDTYGLGKVFLGSTQIGKVFLGSQLVYQYGSGPTPPGPTTTIPYIRGGMDGSYIDTGITVDNTVKVIVWARNFNPSGGALFGSQVAVSSSAFLIGTYGEYNTGRIRVDYANATTQANNQFANLSGYHKYELYQGVLKVDDVTVASITDTTFNSNYNIHLFGLNRGGNHISTTLPTDICACKIYKSGTLVRDFTAVSGGLYDAVSGTTFTNSGSGSLVYGDFDPDAYAPLEYIECTNAQFFDTGIYGKGNMQIALKLRIVGTSVGYPTAFGNYRNRVSGSYFMLQFSNTSYPNRYANFFINTSTANQMYNNNSSRLTNRDIVFYKNATSCQLAENHSLIGTKRTFSVSASFTAPDTIILGSAQNTGTISTGGAFNGYLYYAGFGAERNFVPALVNSVAGMYDTYNDVFYPSTSGTPFVAGPALS